MTIRETWNACTDYVWMVKLVGRAHGRGSLPLAKWRLVLDLWRPGGPRIEAVCDVIRSKLTIDELCAALQIDPDKEHVYD